MSGGPLGGRSFTWHLVNTVPGLARTTAETIIGRAFSRWAAATSLSFTRVGPPTSPAEIAQIQIVFEAIDERGNVFGRVVRANRTRLELDSAEIWSTATAGGPVGSGHLETIVLHEIGRVLGLDHSFFKTAAMWPDLMNPHLPFTNLGEDDRIAVSLLYDRWTPVSTSVALIDIGIGANGRAWAIGADNRVRRWTGSSWTTHGSVWGERIAVAPDGLPWMITPRGEILTRVPNSTSWTLRPGCGTDIGVGADGSVWVVGCTSVGGGFSVHKWNPARNDWDWADGGGLRIAVGPDGVPWLANTAGQVFRRRSSATGNLGWDYLDPVLWPGFDAVDIAVSPHGHGWAISNLEHVMAWNEQPSDAVAPARRDWTFMHNEPGLVANIAAGPSGPWILNLGGASYRTVR